jgi:hypothetical protein
LRVVAGVVAPWRDDATVVRLTSQILRLDKDAATAFADAVVDIGNRLIQARARLTPSAFRLWIEEALPFSPRTVQRYIALALWAKEHRKDFVLLKHLGPTKLTRITALEPKHRKSFVPKLPMRIPGTPRRKTIGAMSVVELDAVIGDKLGFTAELPPTAPIGRVVQGFRHRIAGLDAVANELVARRSEIDENTAQILREEIQAVMVRIEQAFD